jgi:hypothetical protein
VEGWGGVCKAEIVGPSRSRNVNLNAGFSLLKFCGVVADVCFMMYWSGLSLFREVTQEQEIMENSSLGSKFGKETAIKMQTAEDTFVLTAVFICCLFTRNTSCAKYHHSATATMWRCRLQSVQGCTFWTLDPGIESSSSFSLNYSMYLCGLPGIWPRYGVSDFCSSAVTLGCTSHFMRCLSLQLLQSQSSSAPPRSPGGQLGDRLETHNELAIHQVQDNVNGCK